MCYLAGAALPGWDESVAVFIVGPGAVGLLFVFLLAARLWQGGVITSGGGVSIFSPVSQPVSMPAFLCAWALGSHT